MTVKLQGTVKWFNEKKGFGFIIHEDKEYFVYFSSINMPGFKTLTEKAQVLFKASTREKGLVAEEVEVI